MHILGVASVYFIVWTVLRFGKIRKARHANAILVPAVFCLMYAAWEWLVLIKSPEADIRVDLLLIWPIGYFDRLGAGQNFPLMNLNRFRKRQS